MNLDPQWVSSPWLHSLAPLLVCMNSWLFILLIDELTASSPLGPIAGGFITDYLHSFESWRWGFWIPFIISGVLGLNWLWLPETYQITLLEAKAKRAGHQALHAEGGKSKAAIFRVAVGRPLHMLVFEPTVLLVSLYISFLFGIL